MDDEIPPSRLCWINIVRATMVLVLGVESSSP